MPWRRVDLTDGHAGENEQDGENEAQKHLPKTGIRTSDSAHSYPKVAATAERPSRSVTGPVPSRDDRAKQRRAVEAAGRRQIRHCAHGHSRGLRPETPVGADACRIRPADAEAL